MGRSEPPPPSAKSNPNPKKPPVNPKWAQLQQKLNGGRGRRPKLSGIADAGDGALATTVLGKRRERPDPAPEKEAPAPAPAPTARLLTPVSTDCSLTDTLAIDCEMVGVSSEGTKSALARVTLVNTWGNVVYDEYVRPMDPVVDFRTKITGIRRRTCGKEFMLVQKEVAELIKGRILVGHSLHHDLKALLLSHPKMATRDTSEYQPLRREAKRAKRRALRDLAAEILGVKIQQQEHCPMEDARAVMLIYQKYKGKWEKNIKDQLKFEAKLETRPRKKKKKPIRNDSTKSGVLPALRSSQR